MGDALFFTRNDIERQHRQNGAVHGHGDAHLGKVNAVKQRAHVVDAVNGNARHANVGLDARMIGIIAAVGSQIEGDGQALLASSNIAAIKGVGFFCR